MKVFIIILFLVEAYLNVSALVDIEHRTIQNERMKTVLRFVWAWFMMFLMIVTYFVPIWIEISPVGQLDRCFTGP